MQRATAALPVEQSSRRPERRRTPPRCSVLTATAPDGSAWRQCRSPELVAYREGRLQAARDANNPGAVAALERIAPGLGALVDAPRGRGPLRPGAPRPARRLWRSGRDAARPRRHRQERPGGRPHLPGANVRLPDRPWPSFPCPRRRPGERRIPRPPGRLGQVRPRPGRCVSPRTPPVGSRERSAMGFALRTGLPGRRGIVSVTIERLGNHLAQPA